MKKRVNTFADNRLFGGLGEWGLILPPGQEQKKMSASCLPPMSFFSIPGTDAKFSALCLQAHWQEYQKKMLSFPLLPPITFREGRRTRTGPRACAHTGHERPPLPPLTVSW